LTSLTHRGTFKCGFRGENLHHFEKILQFARFFRKKYPTLLPNSGEELSFEKFMKSTDRIIEMKSGTRVVLK
jgi:hypothetical protein